MDTNSDDYFVDIYKITPTMLGSLIFASIGEQNVCNFSTQVIAKFLFF